jgi:predicted metal-dependent hydrolase
MTEEYKVTIKKSKRKTASIYIERDGSVSVLVPENLDQTQIEELLNANEYKIYKFQAKRSLLNENAVKREPVNGQSYLYLGRNYYLQYSDEVEKIEFRGRYFYAPKGSSQKLKELFKEFYRTRAKKYLQSRVDMFADMLGVTVDEIAIFELKNRWASCSTIKPKINFNWKIMMAPASVINYLIVHELTHLIYKRHNADFWNTVDKIFPEYQKQVTWLKQYGASLDM